MALSHKPIKRNIYLKVKYIIDFIKEKQAGKDIYRYSCFRQNEDIPTSIL